MAEWNREEAGEKNKMLKTEDKLFLNKLCWKTITAGRLAIEYRSFYLDEHVLSQAEMWQDKHLDKEVVHW